MVASTLGGLLKDLRERRGLSLAQVRDALGVGGRSTVHHWENGIVVPSDRLGQVLELYQATDEERLRALELAAQSQGVAA